MSKTKGLIVLLCSAALCSHDLHAQPRTMGIDELLSLADANSQSIRAYTTGTEAAGEALKAAKANRLPDISASASASYLANGRLWDRDFGNALTIGMPHFGNNFAIEARQTIYAGGAIDGSIRLAELGRRQAELDREKNRQDTRFELLGCYLDLYKLNNQARVLENNIELAQRVIADMRARREQGTALKNDITRYELQVECLRLQLTKVTDAGIDEAKVQMDNAEREWKRYRLLLAHDAVTQQQHDNVKTAYESAKARYEGLTRARHSTALAKDEQGHRLEQNEAAVRVAEAAVDLARLNLSYTVIVASCDGTTGRKGIHEGQLVQPGQTMVEIVDDADLWVTANYRETQLNNISVGDEAVLTADAVPGVTYTGKVEAISGATGAAYSLIPQDNATGNFVKVEQRVPVRITLAGNDADKLKRLRAGLNVECKVKH